jgi:hypothetical protein
MNGGKRLACGKHAFLFASKDLGSLFDAFISGFAGTDFRGLAKTEQESGRQTKEMFIEYSL